jgi:hypothetical protein
MFTRSVVTWYLKVGHHCEFADALERREVHDGRHLDGTVVELAATFHSQLALHVIPYDALLTKRAIIVAQVRAQLSATLGVDEPNQNQSLE